MKLFSLIFSVALAALSIPAPAQEKRIEAFGKVFLHNDGQRTETQKMGNSDLIREETYDKNDILTAIREFKVNSKGQLVNGIIRDGKGTPLGSTAYTFDERTGQPLEEQLYNKDGKLVRRLFYPGVLKDPRFAKRTVAFTYDPSKPEDRGKLVQGKVKPIVPVTRDEDEFEPGLPQGTAAPTREEIAAQRSGSAVSPKAPGRSFFKQRKP